jgi:cytosine/adenosine deaminase-related metal-dependent hydrolase
LDEGAFITRPSVSRSRRARGINLGLGTDTYPRDLIGEMRWASLVCTIVEHDLTVATSAEVFTAATLGGARALGRDDLGRLARGAKADVVIVDLRSLRIGALSRSDQGPRAVRDR